MSLARKSSSSDEFYDCHASVEEIPSSSRDDSFHDSIDGVGSLLKGSADADDEAESITIENGSGIAKSGDENSGSPEPELRLSHSSHSSEHTFNSLRQLKRESSENENWVSARCLLDNSSEHSNSNENSENRTSARCVLENVPSLMDVVSSSVSYEEAERGNNETFHPEGVHSATAASEIQRTQDYAEDEILPAETIAEPSKQPECTKGDNHLDLTQQYFNIDAAHSSVSGTSEEKPIAACCPAIDQHNMSEHIQEIAPAENVADMITQQNSITFEGDGHHQTTEELSMHHETQIILNTKDIQTSKEESSCFDRQSANGFLPIDSDSTSTANARQLTPTQQEPIENKSSETNFSTPLHQSTKPLGEDCSVLDFCDLTSPLEALYLMCSNAKRGGNMLKKESIQEILDDVNATSPERFSSSYDVDPKSVPPMSPIEDQNIIPESESDDDSSSAASFSSLKKFRIVDRDTGATFDVREVMKDIDEVGESTAFDTRYSFLPSKRDLQRRTFMSGRAKRSDQDNEEEDYIGPIEADSFDTLSSVSYRDSPGIATSKSFGSASSSKKKTKLSDLKSSIASKLNKSTLNRKRTSSTDKVPRNAIHVKSTSRQSMTASSTNLHGQHAGSSSFNPMLLVKTIPKAHDGPAWCAAFSLDGRFLATGGEDGNVCIWTVAPKSTSAHPDIAVLARKEEKKEFDSPVEDDAEAVDSVDIDSPITLDTDDMGGAKVAVDTVSSEEAIPPLNFVGSGPELATNLDILSSEPLQRFTDHTADVIDLSWSHTNFLLTASLDSSVRLYHHSKSQCLHLFKHADLVASVAFHPSDERYFISGGIDKKLRLWSITDGRVKDWAQTPDVITAVRFTPDGRYALAGLFRGQVYFYDTDGLKYYTQIACRNRSGKYKMGRKVTGISFVRGERDDWKAKASTPGSEASSSLENSFAKLTEAGSRVVKRISTPLKGNGTEADALRYTERMLISTNDARVRLYGLNDFCLVRKYKGHANYSMQIRARISESGNYIASGSESGHTFLWKTLDKEWMAKHHISTKLHKTKDKAKSPDYFEASNAQLPIVTDTVFFPYRSVKEALLSSQIFPFQLSMDRVDDDLSSAAILTLDYNGTLRVFIRKTCIDNLLDTATPRGGHLA